jgi:hypothetical protein
VTKLIPGGYAEQDLIIRDHGAVMRFAMTVLPFRSSALTRVALVYLIVSRCSIHTLSMGQAA